MIKLRNWFLAEALSNTTDVFERARINMLFNLLVAFAILNLNTFAVDLLLGAIILEPIVIGIGITTYIALIFRFRYNVNITQSINVFLVYQNSQNIIFTILHVQNDGIDEVFVGFTLIAIVCAFLLAQGKFRPLLLIMSLIPYPYAFLAVNGYNPLPMLVASPREMISEIFIVPVILIIYVIWDFSRTEVSAKRNITEQKLKIEDQHIRLSKQHLALEEEQNKTQNMLHKIETLFGQQVSEAVVKELIAQKKDIKGKTYNVTILFLDIRDFTRFADSRAPEEVASFQNIVFGELIEIIRKNRGITNQILGDGIMAVFGAPVESNSHIVDAIAAGYAIIGKVKELSENKIIPEIRVGIGLHCGKVIAGNIGNNYRKQYSLTGTTVIIASRIEQLNKVYKSQFLVSENVYEEIRNSGYPITKLGDVELKGIEQSVVIYQLA